MSIIVIALIGLFVGFIPGVLLFPWFSSPFGPSLWIFSEPFARIQLTISQFIRRDGGVLVKKADDTYEIGTYLPDEDTVILSDGSVDVDASELNWGLFGKKRFGVTWEPGTDFHERVRTSTSSEQARRRGPWTDGGGGEETINMAAVHRYLRGANDADVISRTKEQAEAKYGGGSEELSDVVMGVLILVMLVMGSLTAMLAI